MNIENKMIGKIFKVLFLMIIISANTVVQAASVSNLVTPVSYFINHVVPLDNLKNNLEKYKQTSVVGISGLGKTQLARMYAYENKDKYDIIWTFDCNLDLNYQFVKLAKEINAALKENITTEQTLAKKEVMDYLVSKNNWLLLFDNLKIGDNKKIQDLVNWEHNGNIIFCSQDSSKLNHLVEVTRFKDQDAIYLISVILKENNHPFIKFLVDEFQGYPILLVQGAQILNNVKGFDYEKYEKMMKGTDNKIRLNIELAMKELSSSAKELLKKIALINNHGFSKSFLKMLTDDQETLDDDIYQLSKYALISNIDSNRDNPVFEMHDVIVKTVQSINNENDKYLNDIIFNVLVKSFPDGVVKKQATRISPTFDENLQIILKNSKKFRINIFKEAKLREELLVTSLNNRKYDLSVKMIEWFEKHDQNKEFNLDHMNDHEKSVYASYLNAIGGYSNFALSNPTKAINYFIRAKEIIFTIENYESIKFNILYQILRTQLDLGQINNAEHTLEEILRVYELGIKNGTVEIFDNSFLYVGKTRLSLTQGRYQQALEQVNKAIDAFHEAGLKDTNMLLDSSYQMKIEIMNYLKLYKEAYSLAKWLYKTYKPYLRSDHEIFANIYTKIAFSQYGLQRYQEGLEYADKAIAIFIKFRNIDPKKLQFTKDIQLAKALMIKADCLAALDNIEESLNIYEKVEAIHNNIYINNLSSSITLKHVLFEATKTACKHHKKTNEFWFKHFYGNLRSIFGIDIREVKEIEQTCNPEIHNKYFQ